MYIRIYAHCMGLYRLGNFICVQDDFGMLVTTHNKYETHSRFMGWIL